MTIRRATLVSDLSTALSAQTALSSNLSTLTADGGSPTSAHVSSAAATHATLSTALSTATADQASFSSIAASTYAVLRAHADAAGPCDFTTALNAACSLIN
jgi:hypothetical protein